MSYWNSTGKFQKAYDYLYDKLIPRSGNSRNKYGELLRVLGRYYYRFYNDGDDYDAMIEEGHDFTGNSRMPELEREKVESMLNDFGRYKTILEDTVNYVLVRTMLHLSTPTKIYNPDSNRLVTINTDTGIKALSKLGYKIDTIYSNDFGIDEPLNIKFKKAITYIPGKKYNDTFDYDTYFNYFKYRPLSFKNEFEYSCQQKKELNILNKLVITTRSIPSFTDGLKELTNLIKILKKIYKIINIKDEYNETPSNSKKLESLNKIYKTTVLKLSSIMTKLQSTL